MNAVLLFWNISNESKRYVLGGVFDDKTIPLSDFRKEYEAYGGRVQEDVLGTLDDLPISIGAMARNIEEISVLTISNAEEYVERFHKNFVGTAGENISKNLKVDEVKGLRMYLVTVRVMTSETE